MDVGGRITSGTVIETTINLCKSGVAASPHPAGVITPHGLRSQDRGINSAPTRAWDCELQSAPIKTRSL